MSHESSPQIPQQPEYNPALDPYASVGDLQASLDANYQDVAGNPSADAEARAAAAADPTDALRYELYGSEMYADPGDAERARSLKTLDRELDTDMEMNRIDVQDGLDRANDLHSDDPRERYLATQRENNEEAQAILARTGQKVRDDAYYDALKQIPHSTAKHKDAEPQEGTDLFESWAEDQGELARDRHNRAVSFSKAYGNDEWDGAVSTLDAAYAVAKKTDNWEEFDGLYNKMRSQERKVYDAHVFAREDASEQPTEATVEPITEEPAQEGGRHARGDRTIIERIMAQRKIGEAEGETEPEEEADDEADSDAGHGVGPDGVVGWRERHPAGEAADDDEEMAEDELLPPAADLSRPGLRRRLADVFHNAAAYLTTQRGRIGDWLDDDTHENRRAVFGVAATVAGALALYGAYKGITAPEHHKHAADIASTGTGAGGGPKANGELLANIPHGGGNAGDLVAGFDPHTHIANGGDLQRALGDLAAQKDVHLTGAQEAELYNHLHSMYGSHFFTDPNSVYHMEGGGLGISHPGDFQWNNGILTETDKWLSAAAKVKKNSGR